MEYHLFCYVLVSLQKVIEQPGNLNARGTGFDSGLL